MTALSERPEQTSESTRHSTKKVSTDDRSTLHAQPERSTVDDLMKQSYATLAPSG